MNPFEVLFVPGGRVGRLSFFLCTLLSTVLVCMVAVFLTLALIGGPSAAFDVNQINTGALIAVALIGLTTFGAYAYSCINLSTKRLHDLGLSGWHVLWLVGLQIVSQVAFQTKTSGGTALGAVLGLCVFILNLMLLFWPGESVANEYGRVP